MAQYSALSQYMLELVNAERAQAGAQPLASDSHLTAAAESHSQWMVDSDSFSHTGAGGSTPTDRMEAAGFDFSGSWSSAENIAWVSTHAPAGLQDEVDQLNTNLMNSPEHHANIMNPELREIGIGITNGTYQSWNGAFVTEDFAKSGAGPFLTGVAFSDTNGDHAYDPGEGLGGITVKAVSASGAVYSTTTADAGGYDLALPKGSYTVTFSGAGTDGSTHQVAIGDTNVKLDLTESATAGTISQTSGSGTGSAPVGTTDGTPAASPDTVGDATHAAPDNARVAQPAAGSASAPVQEATAGAAAPAAHAGPNSGTTTGASVETTGTPDPAHAAPTGDSIPTQSNVSDAAQTAGHQSNNSTGSDMTGSHAGSWWGQQGPLIFPTTSSDSQSNADSHVAQHWTSHAAGGFLDDMRAFLSTHLESTSHVPIEAGLHVPTDPHAILAGTHGFLI